MKKVLFVALVLAGMLVFASAAQAADGDGGTGKMTVLDLILAAGSIGAVIFLCSIVGLYLTIDHFMNISRKKLLPPEFVIELEDVFEQGDYEEAMGLCEVEDNILARTMTAAMVKLDHGYESMVDAFDEAVEEASLALHQKISYVALISNIAPMLGLLGTVVGMIQTFRVFADTPGAGAAELAPGISKALVTTVMGLIVSIPLMIVFQYFRNLIIKIVLESTNVGAELLRVFKPGQRAAG